MSDPVGRSSYIFAYDAAHTYNVYEPSHEKAIFTSMVTTRSKNQSVHPDSPGFFSIVSMFYL